ncbi:MAG TPA: polyprenyl synthetase family protein [Nocardioidaceae bacterium]|nr:polyprenyl synthetase family protein [Nocardioidaceae bacterium]
MSTDTTASLADIEVFRKRVGTRLTEFVTDQASRLDELGPHLTSLLAAANDAVRGGKRLRAVFCYWGWRTAGGDPDDDRIVTASAAMEMLHASALAHDDVMDDSDTRRGRPSAHRQFQQLHRTGRWAGAADQFGTSAAMLLGDLLLSWSDEMLRTCGLDDAHVLAALRYFDAMRTEVVAGQYLDLVAQSQGQTSVPQAMRVVRYKAAKYTVERPLHLGAALAGADTGLLTALTSYGLPLGEAFQLRDDVLGVFGDPEVTGKPAGDDLREGKRTVLMALARERADADQQRLLDRLFGRKKLDDHGVQQLRDAITACGALAAVEELIDELTAAATTALQHAPVHDDAAVTALQDLAAVATSRDW